MPSIVLNSEAIRFVTPDAGAGSVGELKETDDVLRRTEDGGPPVTMRIQETISER